MGRAEEADASKDVKSKAAKRRARRGKLEVQDGHSQLPNSTDATELDADATAAQSLQSPNASNAELRQLIKMAGVDSINAWYDGETLDIAMQRPTCHALYAYVFARGMPANKAKEFVQEVCLAPLKPLIEDLCKSSPTSSSSEQQSSDEDWSESENGFSESSLGDGHGQAAGCPSSCSGAGHSNETGAGTGPPTQRPPSS